MKKPGYKIIFFACLLFIGSAYPVSDTITVNAVGDVMFANWATSILDSAGISYPLKKVKPLLLDADVRVGNLESPMSDTGTPFEKTYTFKIPVRHAGVLLDGGFDVMTLANNHILDNGEIAFNSTIRVLDSIGVKHIGAGRNIKEARAPAIIEKKGKKIGFIGYSLTFPEEFWAGDKKSGTAFGHAAYLSEDIPKLRAKVDYLIVIFHWGVEKSLALKDYQKEMGHLAIDLGADAVVGHHPHILQGIELYKGKPIAYSLGNFCFGTWTNAVWDSAILKLFFADSGFVKAEITPLLINNNIVRMQPRPLTGPDAIKSLKGLSALCDSLNTKLAIEGEKGFVFGAITKQSEMDTGKVSR
jgi:poly-gamma-glutamate capsule biosynthesis protein CapA/YwtB (metallophosphatase superfamily)